MEHLAQGPSLRMSIRYFQLRPCLGGVLKSGIKPVYFIARQPLEELTPKTSTGL